MMSIFPSGQEKVISERYKEGKITLPLTGQLLLQTFIENFNVEMCDAYFDQLVLLFDPILLNDYKYYYISRADNYGEPNDFISPAIINLVETYQNSNINLNKIDNKIISIYKEYLDKHYNKKLDYVLDHLDIWPEVGFYENIDVKKYLIGIIIPSKLMDKKIKNYISELDIKIFNCDKVIMEFN